MSETTTTTEQSVLAAFWYGNDEQTLFTSIGWNAARFLGYGFAGYLVGKKVDTMISKSKDPSGAQLVADAVAESNSRMAAISSNSNSVPQANAFITQSRPLEA